MGRPPLHGPRETTRAVAARVLGVSVGQVRKLEKSGDLKPTVSKEGIHLFKMNDLEALARKRYNDGFRAKAFNGGQIAAAVFRLLEQGKSKSHIVIQLMVEPEVVNKLYDEWKLSFAVRDAQKIAEQKEAARRASELKQHAEDLAHERELEKMEKQLQRGK